ncbi:hypothetical protein [Nocardioides cavernaquae]|uniref:Uncharacterized protein n=1 Tax=Nocardioides cavernaquae TaxID=2321396 RepID=A0A3A5H7A0_9ACTN|nr:hypothetical protein [Nocardioides cavernaquae]RJS45758.1 hypothetical protein D4739_05645 [Nocardioides cavernaquae]
MGFRTMAAAYVLGVLVTAGIGFINDFTFMILLAASLSLPASLIALPGYYVTYGLLALAPGANPSSSSGSASCTADGICHSSTTGDPATWFLVTTDLAGVLALSGAAAVNVIALGHRHERSNV